MIKFESIPLNILRPALEAYAHASGLGILPDDETGEDWDEDAMNGMRAAIAAALSAWPGMSRGKVMNEPEIIILPLTEQTDDKA